MPRSARGVLRWRSMCCCRSSELDNSLVCHVISRIRISIIGFAWLAFCGAAQAQAPVVYVTQNATGNGSGADAADCQSLAWSNASSSWGGGTNQIGPGATVELVGTITNVLLPHGSGSPGLPVTLYFQPGAKLSAPTLPNTMWIDLDNLSHYVIDGGQNGIMEATDTGTSATYGGTFDYTNAVNGISVNNCSDITIRNLVFRNFYVHTARSDCIMNPGYGINGNGFSGPLLVNNCTFSNLCWAVTVCGADGGNLAAGQGGGNINVFSNYFYFCDHGVASLGSYTNINIYNNHFGSTSNWDTTCGQWHHDGIHFFYAPTGSSGNIKIYDNLFDGDWGQNNTAHIYLQGDDTWSHLGANSNVWIYDNVFLMLPGENLNDGSIYGAAVAANVFNNTFVGSSQYCMGLQMINYQGQIENNLFSGPGTFYWLNSWGTGSPNPPSLNNNLYSVTAGRLYWMFGAGWSGYTVWSSWLAFSGETNSIYLGTAQLPAFTPTGPCRRTVPQQARA